MTGLPEVQRLGKHLDATFERVKQLPPNVDLEIQSDFARYLCVLVSGYLERSVGELVLEHARRTGSPTLQRFVESHTRRFANAKAEKLLSLLGSFDPEWRRNLEVMLATEHKLAVDSVVNLRNNIAHGATVGVTYYRIQEYYTRVKQVVDRIAEVCGII